MSGEVAVTPSEERILAHLDARRFDDAARATIEDYGAEILGFLVAVRRNEADAKDVFSQFCEDLWRGMPSFRRTCLVRTWSYKLAKNALSRFLRDPYLRRGRRLETGEVSALVERMTSRISVERAHGKLEEARAALDDDDKTLLVLRIDRKLSWSEIADVMAEEGDKPDAALLRKRFERIKERLRKIVAQRAG